MTHEDTFTAKKGPTLRQVRKSLEGAAAANADFGVIRTSRSVDGVYSITYGVGGRRLDADALLDVLKG